MAKKNFLLTLAAFIWGIAFVAQSVGGKETGAFTFNATRSFIGAVVLIPCILFLNPYKKESQVSKNNKILVLGGVLCGIILFAASNLQQMGLLYTEVGKAGFITALYLVIVPILGLFFKKKVRLLVWISVAIAVVGFYFLCITESISLNIGDLLVLLCSFVFSIHILVIDYFSPRVDGVKLSCIQFLVCGLLSAVCMFIFENPSIKSIISAWVPILYAGVFSCGVAYTLQIIGQNNNDPAVSSLILSLEAVFSAIASVVILNEKMEAREIFGCFLIFVAIILTQLPQRKTEKNICHIDQVKK